MSNNTSTKQIIPFKKINVTIQKSSSDIVTGGLLYIPISINKSQSGTNNLFIGKKITLFNNNLPGKTLLGSYSVKLDGTEYLKINSVSQLDGISFDANTIFTYNEISEPINDTVPLTIADIKRMLISTKNSEYKGTTGLMEPLHLEAIESIKYFREVNQKSISDLLSYTITMYYETNFVDKDNTLQFGLLHSLFNAEYELKTFGTSNFTIRCTRFGATESIPNLNIGIIINKIVSNDSTKILYQINIKLNNIPSNLQNNVEKVKCYINETLTKQNIFSTLPLNYNLTNSTLFLSEKIFTRYILFFDNNGVVSLNPNESIKLLSNQDLNNILNFGWYHYDVYNSNDLILNNLPTNYKNVFYLNVKRLSDNLLIQYLYVLDSTNNIIRYFSRIRNNSSLTFSPWVEYVTEFHKHNATDIITDNTHLFVTQTEKDTWNSYATSLSDYWNNAVATVANLPSTGLNGEARLCLADMKIYSYVANDNAWKALNDPKLALTITSDNIKIRINEGGTGREVTLPIVTNSNPGLLPADVNAGNYKSYFESNLNFTLENTGTEVPGYYQKQLGPIFNILDSDNVKIKDGVNNYVIGTNGSMRIIDLTNISNKIEPSLFTKYDTNNILSQIITEYQFIIKTNNFVTTKIIFGSDKTVTITKNDGTQVNHTNPELLNLNNNQKGEVLFKINGNNISIYELQ